MKIVTLASGSKGNSIYLETDEVKVLIDIGITIKQIEERLSLLEVDPKTIS